MGKVGGVAKVMQRCLAVIGDGIYRKSGDIDRFALCRLQRNPRPIGNPALGRKPRQRLLAHPAFIGRVEQYEVAGLARGHDRFDRLREHRSEEHTSELQSLMRISYAVFCLKKKTTTKIRNNDKHEENNKL